MLKHKVVPTSLGDLTLSALTLGDIRSLPNFFSSMEAPANGDITAEFDRFVPAIAVSLRRVHQDITSKTLEEGITLQDFHALVAAMMEIAGVQATGEAKAAGA